LVTVLAHRRRLIKQLSHGLVEGMLADPMNNISREIDIGGKDQEELLRLLAKLLNINSSSSNRIKKERQ
jgi:hypothetical protein